MSQSGTTVALRLAMKFWLRSSDNGHLDAVEGRLQALLRLSEAPGDSLVLTAFDPTREFSELTAFLRLASKLGADPADIVVLTAHPSPSWLRQLVAEGFTDLRFAVVERPEEFRPPGIPAREAADRVCPELHVARGGKRALSVCGLHEDRMVLSPRHLTAWCLGDHRHCPYRSNRGEDDADSTTTRHSAIRRGKQG